MSISPPLSARVAAAILIIVISPPISANSIEEVVVSARKFKETLLETPVSISAFRPGSIRALGVEEVKDVDSYTPGLVIRKQNGSQDNYAFSIRGVNTSETALTGDPTVGVYLDGVYLARTTGGVFDLVDLSRVEVLRGPQGALFGRNTIGGAINLISTKPTGQSSLSLDATSGNRHKSRFKAVLDLPEMAGIRGRLAYLKDHTERDYRSAFSGEPLGDADSIGYRASFEVDLGESLIAGYSFDKIERENNSNIHQLTLVRDVYADPASPFYGGNFYDQARASASSKRSEVLPASNTSDDETTSKTEGHNLTLEWMPGDRVTVKSITSHRQWDSFASGTEFGTFEIQSFGDMIDLRNGGAGVVSPGERISIFSATRKNTHTQISQEFQFNLQVSDAVQAIIGLYGMNDKGDEDNPQEFVLPTRVVPFLAAGVTIPAVPATGTAAVLNAPFYYEYENESRAVFAHLDIDLTEKVTLSVGGRYTEDEKSALLSNTLDGESEAKTLESEESWADFSPSATIRYMPTERATLYLKYAQGYRSGGYNARSQTSSAFLSPYDQEFLDSFEIGVKTRALNDRLSVNTAVFLNDYTNQQVSQFEAGSGGASSVTVNAGKSKAFGLEIEAVYVTPIEGLIISGNYAYLDFEYKEYVSGPLSLETGFPSGQQNEDIADHVSNDVYAPDHSGAIGIAYEKPLSWGVFSARIDVSYIDSITFGTILYEYDKADSYSLVNGRVSLAELNLAGADLDLSLWGKNLGNKEYREQGLDFGLVGIVSNSYGELRSYGMDIRLSW